MLARLRDLFSDVPGIPSFICFYNPFRRAVTPVFSHPLLIAKYPAATFGWWKNAYPTDLFYGSLSHQICISFL